MAKYLCTNRCCTYQHSSEIVTLVRTKHSGLTSQVFHRQGSFLRSIVCLLVKIIEEKIFLQIFLIGRFRRRIRGFPIIEFYTPISTPHRSLCFPVIEFDTLTSTFRRSLCFPIIEFYILISTLIDLCASFHKIKKTVTPWTKIMFLSTKNIVWPNLKVNVLQQTCWNGFSKESGHMLLTTYRYHSQYLLANDYLYS